MRLAVLGLGFMGATHLKAIKNIPGIELAAVSSDIPETLTGDLSSVQGNIGGPGEKYDFSNVRKYTDVWDALRDREIDAYDICLPTHLHAPAAIEALRTGRHVLVEKPMGLDAAEPASSSIYASRRRLTGSTSLYRGLPGCAAPA